MRVVIQRVREASVSVHGKIHGRIGAGYVLLVGIGKDDTEEDLEWMADKICRIRIINDPDGKMNLDIIETGGSILSISQFTLYASTRKGRRPSFTEAASPELGRTLYENFNSKLRTRGLRVEEGQFGEDMKVSLVNEGPVTVILDSSERFIPRRASHK